MKKSNVGNTSLSEARFIVLEGIDGAGTTTQARMLWQWLLEHGHQAALTCEPSSGPIGLLLRQILSGRTLAKDQDGGLRPICNDSISLLFAADRLDHLDCEIEPLLTSKTHVICDRYFHSSFTYQSLLGNMDWLLSINSKARSPDVTYILEVPAEEASRRRQSSRLVEELYENLETQKKLEQAYLRLPEWLPHETIVMVDGTKEKASILDFIVKDLVQRWNF